MRNVDVSFVIVFLFLTDWLQWNFFTKIAKSYTEDFIEDYMEVVIKPTNCEYKGI